MNRMSNQENVISKLEKEVQRTYSTKTTVFQNGAEVSEEINPHREPYIKIPIEMADKILALLKEQNELLKQSDERYFNMVISWFREMITYYEFHLQTLSNRHTTFIEAFKDVHDFAYDSLRNYFKQKGGEQDA